MENTSSGSARSQSLLMLSRAVYVKKPDNTFYPGAIDTKLPDGSYSVKFTDGSSDRVPENHIMWLGFWGLPPKCWPRNPIVQTAGPVDMALDFLSAHRSGGNTSQSVSRKTHLPDRNVRRVVGFPEMDLGSTNIPRRSENDFVSRDDDGINEFETSSAHVQPRQISENQPRCVIHEFFAIYVCELCSIVWPFHCKFLRLNLDILLHAGPCCESLHTKCAHS